MQCFVLLFCSLFGCGIFLLFVFFCVKQCLLRFVLEGLPHQPSARIGLKTNQKTGPRIKEGLRNRVKRIVVETRHAKDAVLPVGAAVPGSYFYR